MEDFPGVEDVLGDLTRRETIGPGAARGVPVLPPVYREAVVLCDLQDLSYGEAAQILDCPVGTVRSRLNRGRAMLAQKLRLLDSSVTNPFRNSKMGSTGLIKRGLIKRSRGPEKHGARARRGECGMNRRTKFSRA